MRRLASASLMPPGVALFGEMDIMERE